MMPKRAKIALCMNRTALAILMALLLSTVATALVAAQESTTVTAPKNDIEKTHGRKPTLQELYAMFFTYATHVETRAIADEKLGMDRKFYKQHLQKASGLTAEEYAQVLASAQRYAAVDSSVKSQIADVVKTNQTLGVQSKKRLSSVQPTPRQLTINDLRTQKSVALTSEIADLHNELGTERILVLESYLQNKYVMGHIGPEPPKKYSLHSASSDVIAAPETVNIGSGNSCDSIDLDDGGTMTICSDAQMIYLGSPQSDFVEFYASMSASCDDDNGCALTSYSVEGDFYVDGEEHDKFDCDNSGATCWDDVQLNSGSGASYDWIAIGYADWEYDEECEDEDGDIVDCYSDDGDHESAPASVTIYYPDINTFSPNSVDPGNSGSLTIDGEYLISPFQNQPTVTTSGGYFNEFNLAGFNYEEGTITISYDVLSTANPGTSDITVNNGFETDSDYITINAPPPTITSISVSTLPAYPSDAGDLVAGNTQTVTLTGENFGTGTPTITVASDSQYVTIVPGSVGTPSLVRARKLSKAMTSHTKSHPATSSASPEGDSNTTQTVSFNVQVLDDATGGGVDGDGSASFTLQANDGSQTPSTTSPSVTVVPEQPTPPVILDGSANDNDDTCSADNNIGQGAASAQLVVVGQLVSFTACVPNPNFSGWGGTNTVTATWAPPSSFTTTSAVANYAQSNSEQNTNVKLGKPSLLSGLI
jgi:hypothetical protein